MTDLGEGEASRRPAPEAEIVASTVTRRNDLSAGEVRTEAAVHYGYWHLLAMDPAAQQEVKTAMLERAAADTAVNQALAEVHKAEAEVKKENARKQRLENDRIEDLKEQNRPFVRFTLKYGVRVGAGFLFALGAAEGFAGFIRIVGGTGTVNLTITVGLLGAALVIALAPSAIAAILGKIKG